MSVESGSQHPLASSASAQGSPLTAPMRRLLWTIAQHKYGWAHCIRQFGANRFKTAEALERRGLVTIDADPYGPTCSATDAGRAVIAELFPVSPFVLRTYEHQAGGWTPCEP